jgi:hypothetical protein
MVGKEGGTFVPLLRWTVKVFPAVIRFHAGIPSLFYQARMR